MWWWWRRSVTPCLARCCRTGRRRPRCSAPQPRERALLEREAVSIQLRQLGVEVVDAEPHELPPQLVDAYIRLKAAGRLSVPAGMPNHQTTSQEPP